MSNGYFSLPRALYEHKAWIGAKLKYRSLFHEIAARAVWKEKEYNANGHTIILKPGQYCSSIRRMVTDFNPQGLRGKAAEDTFSKNDIEGGIQYFLYHGLLRQEIRHDITILTICISGLCDEFDKVNQTVNQTIIRQKSDTKEEREEREEERKEKYKKEKIFSIEEIPEAINQDFQGKAELNRDNLQHNVYNQTILGQSLKTKIKSKTGQDISNKINFREWVSLTQKEHDTLIDNFGSNLASVMLDLLDAYNTSRQEHYKSDYGALKRGGWVHEKALKQINEKPKLKGLSNADYAKECAVKFGTQVTRKGYVLHLGHDYIEFSPNGGNGKVFHLKFQENGFRDQLDLILKKFG